MDIYVITKLSDYGDGFSCAVMATKTDLAVAQDEMKSLAAEELADYELGFDYEGVYESGDEIEIDLTDSEENYGYIKFEIHKSSIII
jgi:hypothetical protein